MRRLLAPIAVLTVVATAACGSDDDGGGNSSSGETGGGTTTIAVGVIPITDVAPLYLGQDQGFFEDHGLELELTQLAGGAAAVPGVVAGDFQFAFGNVTSTLLAGSQDLPLRIVAEGVSSTGDPETDFCGIVVPANSPIQSAADLAGKKVAINTLKNINDLTTRKVVEDAGGDPSTIQFLELPFPDMGAALQNGNIEAAQVVEPFLSAAKAQGARQIAANCAESVDDLTVATYFTTEQYIQENPDLVDDFQAAIQESLTYANDNPDEVRRIITTYTQIPEEVAAGMNLPAWPAEVNVDSLEEVAELMTHYGFTEETVDVDTLLATD